MAMTSDSGRGMTVEERDEFLTSGTIFAKIATTMADGWPVVSPVWFDWQAQDHAFLVISKARTSMVQNLHRDPRCGCPRRQSRPALHARERPGRGEVPAKGLRLDHAGPQDGGAISRRTRRSLCRNDVRISQRALSRPCAKDNDLERWRVRPHLLQANDLARHVRASIAERLQPMRPRTTEISSAMAAPTGFRQTGDGISEADGGGAGCLT